MNTITTRQLRETMSKVVNDLQQGMPISLSYRHKIIGIIQPVNVSKVTLRRGSPQAIRQGLKALRGTYHVSAPNNNDISIKEQIAKYRGSKYSK